MSGNSTERESMKVVGYTDRLSVQPGQRVRFMVSCREASYNVSIVRLIHGDENSRGPGFKEEKVQSRADGEYRGRIQRYRKGSYILVRNRPPLRRLSSFTIQAWIYPTTPKKWKQGIITQWGNRKGSAYGLFIDENGQLALNLRGGNGEVEKISSGKDLHAFTWYFVAGTYDERSGIASVRQHVVSPCKLVDSDSLVERNVAKKILGSNEEDLMVAGYRDESQDGVIARFNGKIDGAKIFSRSLPKSELERLMVVDTSQKVSKGLVASWDFARNTHSTRIGDLSRSKLVGTSVNFPARAVTGHNWSGREHDFKRAPEEYNAIHFHDDDLTDAGWKVDFEFAVPANLKSGVYAAHLTVDGSEDYVPFFVRPRKGGATAKICLLMPTLSYLAYANEHTLVDPAIRRLVGAEAATYPSQRQDVHVVEHNLLSLYDHHTDGSGVCYTSRLRPILNMRPKYNMQSISKGKGSPHQFNADLHLLDWLVAKGYSFDVITDEDIHHEGLKLLSPYKVVVTGSHPEYWSGQMLDTLQRYLNNGGRLMYLGGNGFYWVTTVNPEHPHVFEVRRWGGTGSWMAKPGEYYNSFTGELGGVWRNRGRYPQKTVGIGFSAQGFDVNKPYKRQPGSFDERASFVFEGVGPDELVGDFPSLVQESGAAGFELDRLDFELGTPPHTLLLATAVGFSDNYQHVIEENTLSDGNQGGTTHPLVRADMIYFNYPKNGGVFSVGSIAWCGSLSYNNYDNNVSRITGNVLDKFSSSGELP